jgi:putative drug exporter of the RND superfamily
VAEMGKPATAAGLVQYEVTLRDGADSKTAEHTVDALRAAVHAVPNADAKVGGSTATSLDINRAASHDNRLIIPIVLAVVFLILVLLLRAVVAPLLLVATVALSTAATVGLGALAFEHLFDFPGSDPQVLLIGFVFLVALGIDYNIFLMTRAREESMVHGTRAGMTRALTVTGGVITSAGLVLAATFGALTVLPLVLLIQLGFLVGVGVLIDTFIVRSLLVPAAVDLIGDRVWWPSALAKGPTVPQPERELTRI